MLSCQTCKVLRKIRLKENRWSTASNFYEYFGRIACFISKKSTTAVHKRLRVFALEMFKDS